MTAEQSLALRRLRFPTELEDRFRAWHYTGVRGNLRIGIVPVIAFALFSAVRDYLFGHAQAYAIGGNGAVIVCCLLLLALTAMPWFERCWKPVTVVLIWLAMTIMLDSPAVTGKHVPPPGAEPSMQRTIGSAAERDAQQRPTTDRPPPAQELGIGAHDQVLAVQLCTLLIFLTAFRLGFYWTLALDSSLLLSACWVLTARLHVAPQNLLMFMERMALVLFALMLGALWQERLARSAFLANYLLDQERNDERRMREQTEGKLKVLGQAIGGIVHDLGNPLGAVQGGAQLLVQVMEDEKPDARTLRELADIIQEGTNLLNCQRLSLMEQTRVLEGKPIPLECEPTSLRRVLDTAVLYQNPKYLAKRQVVRTGEDVQVQADAMKLTSVFMNLIGNALKYSDGDVRVSWQVQEQSVLIAVMDRGRDGIGLTEAQAAQLFVAFGRLDAHTKMEGTGLGLLSVRKIVEAHGGEVYVEGHRDGIAESPLFRTAQTTYPSMLMQGALTAFVVVCPNALQQIFHH